MKEITLEAVLENIPEVTAFVDRELEACDCGMKAQLQIDVAIDEICSNIARYAYAPGHGTVTVQFSFDAPSRTAAITFIDAGTPFDPLEKADPDVGADLKAREIGGLGIFLVKKTMDDVRYRRADDQNVLTLLKKI